MLVKLKHSNIEYIYSKQHTFLFNEYFKNNIDVRITILYSQYPLVIQHIGLYYTYIYF